MTAPAREAENAPDATDVVLGLWEEATRAALAIGGEAAIRTRLARLMPQQATPPPALGAVELTQILTALRAGEGRIWSDGERAARAAAKALVLGAIENSKRRG